MMSRPSLLRALQTHDGWMLSDALILSDNSADDCGLNPAVYRGTVKLEGGQWRQTSFGEKHDFTLRLHLPQHVQFVFVVLFILIVLIRQVIIVPIHRERQTVGIWCSSYRDFRKLILHGRISLNLVMFQRG